MPAKKLYALRILNKTFDKLNITATEKVDLCNKFVQEIRNDRKQIAKGINNAS